jgi:hypothetical protein
MNIQGWMKMVQVVCDLADHIALDAACGIFLIKNY